MIAHAVALTNGAVSRHDAAAALGCCGAQPHSRVCPTNEHDPLRNAKPLPKQGLCECC